MITTDPKLIHPADKLMTIRDLSEKNSPEKVETNYQAYS
jgi:hypothetical protein